MTQTIQTGDEIKAALVAGAKHVDALNMRAAVHLLVFTDLPNQGDFEDRFLLDSELRPDPRVHTEGVATVRRWMNVSTSSATEYLSFDDRRLLQFAASFAAGLPVNLRDATHGLAPAHTRRLIEAIAIASGSPELADL